MRLTREQVAQLPPAIREQLEERPVQMSARAKYGNQAAEADGLRFDSKLEMGRYLELKAMQLAGLIEDLQVHVALALHAPTVTGELVRIGAYEADFTYRRQGRWVVEDCKSLPTRRTPIYRWKQHHFALEYGVTVAEIERPHRKAVP